MLRSWISPLLAGLLAATLAGCGAPRLVEGQVQSFSTLTAAPAPATYRIERLPSQQTPAFDPIAALADQALARVGLQRDDAAPGLLVQIGTESGTTPRYDLHAPHGFYGQGPWGYGTYGGYGAYGAYGSWYGGAGWGMRGLWSMGPPTPLYRRVVSVVMRNARTQAIVYETAAVHEDVWVQDPAVYGVLLDAALTGFPAPPAGARVVRLPLPVPAR